jgi:uncharacterized protein (TIGR03435 family)
MRGVKLTIVAIYALSVAGIARQGPSVPLRFEVASVKPSPVPFVPPRQAGGRLSLALPLASLIVRAYGLHLSQVVGGGPLMSQSFDISAKAENAEATPAEMNQMLKSLLLDRFQLKAHTEMREAGIWVLRMARSDGALGPRLKRSSRSCATREEYQARTEAESWVSPDAGDPCAQPMLFPVRRVGQPISDLVYLLRLMCCPFIEDRTGLIGRYDWDVIEPTPRSVDPNAPSPSGPAILIAELERQLGLKVEEARGQVEFLVIDSVQPPTPN